VQRDLLDGKRGSRNGFSHREIQVLELASQGMTNREIARRLGLSVHGVKFHLGAVYKKLGVANRTEAAVAFTLGLGSHATARDGSGSDGREGPGSGEVAGGSALAPRLGAPIPRTRRRGGDSLIA
jgi:DNA-binding CsgD family transcriptional regulator